MYICLCNGITDGAIRCAIRDQGIKTLCGLAEKLDVGTQCGCCCEAAQELLRETSQQPQANPDTESWHPIRS
jgi:bacterioferritin-associated ferredoxin